MLKHFPRLTTVGLSYLAAFLVFAFLGPDFFNDNLPQLGIIGIFIAGMLYTYSFTAAIGALLLITIAHDYSPGLIAVVGGIGSLVSDMTIYRVIRNDLHKEVSRLARTPIMKKIGATPVFKVRWFRDALGALVLASPLPDEIGVALMTSARMKESTFLYMAFIADMVGIYLLVTGATIFL